MKKLEMRDLMFDDIYLVSVIADKMDLELPSSTKKVKGKEVNKTQEEYGVEVGTIMLKRIHRAQNEVNQLLSKLLGKDVSELTIIDAVKTFKELFSDEGFQSFFK